MIRKGFLLTAASVVALLTCCSGKEDDVNNGDEKQSVPREYVISVLGQSGQAVKAGDIVTFRLRTNVDDLECSSEDGTFELVESTDSSAAFSLKKINLGAERKAGILFSSALHPEADTREEVTVGTNMLLDVTFKEDGTAEDAACGRFIRTYPGNTLFTYYNEDAQRTVARFTPGIGTALTNSFYKMDYTSDSAFKDAVSDGFTMEAQFMMSCENTTAGEVKVFSSMQAGGFGIMLTSDTKEITFLPNISTSGSSNWAWTRSGVVPEVGKYYHVVGVWDRNEGKTSVYVNGELKKTCQYSGNLVFPAAGCNWLCTGADPSGSFNAETAWCGDVVLARIYDSALESEDIAALWQAADKSFMDWSSINNIAYLPECTVAPGSEYFVMGTGFRDGDIICLEGSDGVVTECGTTVSDDRITIVIPDGLKSGTYKIYAVRDGHNFVIGNVKFTISSVPTVLKRPDVVAHRGYHTGSSSTPENSIAALKAAQDIGCDAVELDCWITTDGEVYINHDGIISGVTIQNSTSEQVAKINLSNGEKIPTLKEFMTEAKNVPATRIVVEIKSHSTAERNNACVDATIAIINELQMQDQVHQYISFNIDVCKRIASALPDKMVGFLSAADINSLYNAGIMCADFPYSDYYTKPSYISEAHKKGMYINVWTVDSEADMLRCIGLGVDAITTNYPEKLIAICDKLF